MIFKIVKKKYKSKKNLETNAYCRYLTTKYKLIFTKGQLIVSEQGLGYVGFRL